MLPTVSIADEPARIPLNATAELLAAFFSGRSTHTIAAYRADLEDFRAFLGAETVETAAARVLSGSNGAANALALAWRSHLTELGRSPATINRRLSALRALIALGRTLGLIAWGIDIRNLRAEAYRNTAGPKQEGVVALLAMALAQKDRRKAARDAALIRLLHDTGLRRGEVCSLDMSDIDLSGSRIQVLGKGKREKVGVTLPDVTRSALAAWIAVRGPAAGAVFIALDRATDKSKRQRVTGTGVWHIITTLSRSAGAPTRPHGLRHRAITSALDATNGDVRAVQRFSRHADVRTLGVYDDNREDLGGKVAAMIAVQ